MPATKNESQHPEEHIAPVCRGLRAGLLQDRGRSPLSAAARRVAVSAKAHLTAKDGGLAAAMEFYESNFPNTERHSNKMRRHPLAWERASTTSPAGLRSRHPCGRDRQSTAPVGEGVRRGVRDTWWELGSKHSEHHPLDLQPVLGVRTHRRRPRHRGGRRRGPACLHQSRTMWPGPWPATSRSINRD